MSVSYMQGAVLLSESGEHFNYREKCDSCGWIDDTTSKSGWCGPGGGTENLGSFTCPKCGNNQEVSAHGSPF